MMISDEHFKAKFDINNSEWLDMIVTVIKCEQINDLDTLLIAGNIAKHVE